MTDRPEVSSSEQGSNIAREALLAAVQGKSYIAGRGAELARSVLLPGFVLLEADPLTDSQRLAINTYEQMPGFSGLGDEKRFPSNTRALALAKKNIGLDRDGARTIDADGRIVAIRLPDPAEKAHLGAALLFPFGYKDAERSLSRLNLSWSQAERESSRLLADYYREGFRLALKKEGFEETDAGIRRLARAGLTPGEQLKLDCLTFKALTAKRSSGETLSAFEQQGLTDAVRRLNEALTSDNPDEFTRKWKCVFSLCRNENDRKVFLMGIAGLLSDEANGRQLADSFEKWFNTNKYAAALSNWLRDKDTPALRRWVESNDREGLATFPRSAGEGEVEMWLRRRHAENFADRWARAMTEFGNVPDQGAFQDFANLALGKRDRFGTLAGLLQALNDLRNRPGGDRTKPADPQKVKDQIVAAGTNPDGTSSKARPPGVFIVEPVVLPEEARPSWWKRGLQAAGIPIAVGLSYLATDIVGTYGSRLTVGRFWERANLKPGWTLRLTGEAARTVRDTVDFATGGRFRGLQDPVARYTAPTEEELLLSSRGNSRASSSSTEAVPVPRVETINIRGLNLVVNKQTAREVVRELRRLETDRGFERFLDEQIREEKDGARKQELREAKERFGRMTAEEKAAAKAEVIRAAREYHQELLEGGRVSALRARRLRIMGGATGGALIALLALGYAIRAASRTQETPPSPIPPGAIPER